MLIYKLDLVGSSVPVNREVHRLGRWDSHWFCSWLAGVAPLVYFRPSAQISMLWATLWGIRMSEHEPHSYSKHKGEGVRRTLSQSLKAFSIEREVQMCL